MSRYSSTDPADVFKAIFLLGFFALWGWGMFSGIFKGCTGSDPISYTFAGTIHSRAVEDATRYAREMHHDWRELAVDCQTDDSDGDGYVSCTIGDGHTTTEPIQCRASIVRGDIRHCSRATNRAIVR